MHTALRKTDPKYQKKIMQFFCQIEHLFKMFVDTGEIRIVSSALDLVDADTFSIHKTANNEDITSSHIYGVLRLESMCT